MAEVAIPAPASDWPGSRHKGKEGSSGSLILSLQLSTMEFLSGVVQFLARFEEIPVFINISNRPMNNRDMMKWDRPSGTKCHWNLPFNFNDADITWLYIYTNNYYLFLPHRIY